MPRGQNCNFVPTPNQIARYYSPSSQFPSVATQASPSSSSSSSHPFISPQLYKSPARNFSVLTHSTPHHHQPIELNCLLRSNPSRRKRRRMLPGVELARRRRVHYHGDGGAAAATAAAGEYHGHYSYYSHHQKQRAAAAEVEAGGGGGGGGGGGAVSPAVAARIRLEEKLRGAAAPSSSALSRWGRRFRERDGSAASRQHNNQREQQSQLPTEPRPAPSPSVTMLEAPSRKMTHRREMRMTLSKADLCAVCLDEVRERHQRVTRLPCSHKYHSECVLPWLAIQPDCPCCRTLVPSVDSLFVT
uniref:RING-type domain-containing protein n=1 Tax=Leersia perrieri TaxID=77586 RepID=A0A0D9XTL5_9ORYZ